MKKRLAAVTGAAILLALGLGVYSLGVEPYWVELVQVNVAVPSLPERFDGYRIVQLSDLHVTRRTSEAYLEKAASLTNAQTPDLIVLTGDFTTGDPALVREKLEGFLIRLNAGDGVLAVMGNHDHWNDPDRLARILEASGVRLLKNELVRIQREGQSLPVIGLDDHMEGLARLDAALTGLDEGEKALLLVHEPDYAAISWPTGRIFLQLSGHTHGGQVSLPVVGSPVLPAFGRLYPRGLIQVGEMGVYTNRGIGTLFPHVRLLTRPEITVFTLTR